MLGESERRLHVEEERKPAGADAFALLAARDALLVGKDAAETDAGQHRDAQLILVQQRRRAELGELLGRPATATVGGPGLGRGGRRRGGGARRPAAARRGGRAASCRAASGAARRSAPRAAVRPRTDRHHHDAPIAASAHAGASLVESRAPGEGGNPGAHDSDGRVSRRRSDRRRRGGCAPAWRCCSRARAGRTPSAIGRCFVSRGSSLPGLPDPRPTALRRLAWEIVRRTSVATASDPAELRLARSEPVPVPVPGAVGRSRLRAAAGGGHRAPAPPHHLRRLPAHRFGRGASGRRLRRIGAPPAGADAARRAADPHSRQPRAVEVVLRAARRARAHHRRAPPGRRRARPPPGGRLHAERSGRRAGARRLRPLGARGHPGRRRPARGGVPARRSTW